MGKRIGYLLKLLRNVRELNQQELAARSGLHYTTISAYEMGYHEPNENTVRKALAGLGCTPVDLEMADDFCRLFLPASRTAEPAPEEQTVISEGRMQAFELAVASGRLAYRRTKIELDLLVRIEEAIRAEKKAAGESGTA